MAKNIHEDSLRLKVTNGDDILVNCVGTTNEVKCQFLEKRIDFGNILIG